jgi:hypothetical protein
MASRPNESTHSILLVQSETTLEKVSAKVPVQNQTDQPSRSLSSK